MSAEIAIGIASVVVTFRWIVGGLWGTGSTVYFDCKCCIASGGGPAVAVGARVPNARWLPVRLGSGARPVPPAATFAATAEPGAIVPSVTTEFERMSWAPDPVSAGMLLRLAIDGRSFVFKSCANSATEGGRRVFVGGISKARAVGGKLLTKVVDNVSISELCELASQSPSNGCFRMLRTCASHTSSPTTYAVNGCGSEGKVRLRFGFEVGTFCSRRVADTAFGYCGRLWVRE